MNRQEIKNAIENNDFLTLENLFFNGTEREKMILFDELTTVIEKCNHIKNILK